RPHHLQPVRLRQQLAVRCRAVGDPARGGARRHCRRRPARAVAFHDMMRVALPVRMALWTVAGAVLVLLFGPLAVAMFFSFFKLRSNQVQWDSFSFEAYGKLPANENVIDALGNTLLVGSAAVAAALVLGTLLAFYYHGGRSRTREWLQLVIFL